MKEKLERESDAEEVYEGQSSEDDDSQSPASEEQASGEDESSPDIEPVHRKIGEGRDNLRRREEWFQRRTGTRK